MKSMEGKRLHIQARRSSEVKLKNFKSTQNPRLEYLLRIVLTYDLFKKLNVPLTVSTKGIL